MPSHLQGSSCPRTFQEAVEGHVRDRCSPESKVLLGFIHTWFLFLVTCDKDVSAVCVLLFVFCTSSPFIRLVLCTAGHCVYNVILCPDFNVRWLLSKFIASFLSYVGWMKLIFVIKITLWILNGAIGWMLLHEFVSTQSIIQCSFR
ncbi:hypothetical protein IMY05_002G0042700 [Salix suchowensis]|nr:hypothetical protein IMY05_002G0042700 [Salix suchowensis]